jgi:naphthoate synthase/2-ketocyclohexanecarboxyl-CoA hydrolase
VVGAKKAKEIWMLCRRYTAQEACEMGLVNKVVPLEKIEEEVDQWCEEILSLSPGCIEILKSCFDMDIHTLPPLGYQSGLLYPNYFDTAEGKEGAVAFTEKRKPNFWKARFKDLGLEKEEEKKEEK